MTKLILIADKGCPERKYEHTIELRPYHVEISIPIRAPKLSKDETGQYLDGCQLENSRCFNLEFANSVNNNDSELLIWQLQIRFENI